MYALIVIEMFNYGDHVSGTYYIKFDDDINKITKEMNGWMSAFSAGFGNEKQQVFENKKVYRYNNNGLIMLVDTNKDNSIVKIIKQILLRRAKKLNE